MRIIITITVLIMVTMKITMVNYTNKKSNDDNTVYMISQLFVASAGLSAWSCLDESQKSCTNAAWRSRT